MSFLERMMTKTNGNSTRGLYLGATESEGEISKASRIYLDDVYISDSGIIDGIMHEKFIIIGRKGSGKSALANYFYIQSASEPLIWCDLIKKNDIDLEKIVQIGKELKTDIEISALFQWVILNIINTPSN